MKFFKYFTALLLICGLTGCSSFSTLRYLKKITAEPWELASLNGAGIDTSTFPDGLPSLSFQKNGDLTGFGGCNNFTGGYLLEKGDLAISPGAMTQMACQGNGENMFMEALNRVDKFQLKKDLLTLFEGEEQLMTFQPKNSDQ